jgi:hypothetical protein
MSKSPCLKFNIKDWTLDLQTLKLPAKIRKSVHVVIQMLPSLSPEKEWMPLAECCCSCCSFISPLPLNNNAATNLYERITERLVKIPESKVTILKNWSFNIDCILNFTKTLSCWWTFCLIFRFLNIGMVLVFWVKRFLNTRFMNQQQPVILHDPQNSAESQVFA